MKFFGLLFFLLFIGGRSSLLEAAIFLPVESEKQVEGHYRSTITESGKIYVLYGRVKQIYWSQTSSNYQEFLHSGRIISPYKKIETLDSTYSAKGKLDMLTIDDQKWPVKNNVIYRLRIIAPDGTERLTKAYFFDHILF